MNGLDYCFPTIASCLICLDMARNVSIDNKKRMALKIWKNEKELIYNSSPFARQNDGSLIHWWLGFRSVLLFFTIFCAFFFHFWFGFLKKISLLLLFWWLKMKNGVDVLAGWNGLKIKLHRLQWSIEDNDNSTSPYQVCLTTKKKFWFDDQSTFFMKIK